MAEKLQILIVEDISTDYELSVRELSKDGLDFKALRVETEEQFREALSGFNPDIVISDYNMPTFDGLKALNITRQHDAFLPFIIFTGSMNEEIAVQCLKAGATDYVIKESLKRLPHAVKEAMAKHDVLVEKNKVLQKLKENESQLQRAEKIANIGSWEFDMETGLITASTQTKRIYGLCDDVYPYEVIHSMPLEQYTPMLEKAMNEHINTGKPYDIEFQIRRANDQEIRHIHSIGEFDRERKKFIGIIRDITEKKNNDILRQEILIAREAARFKQNFLAQMSHEIRTPLTGIEGMIEMLEKSNLDATQRDYIETIKFSSGSLKSIINEVLDFSKIEAGEMKIKPVSFKLEEIFIKSEKLFSSICKKNLNFSTKGKEQLPRFLKADKHRIFQIITNLISNAVKYSHTGEVILEAALDKVIENDIVLIRIMIHDSGSGISDEMKDKLFKPFFQIQNINEIPIEGTGLGLSICKELAGLLGGEIGFESTSGKGSTFWFTFQAQIMVSEATEDILKTHINLNKTQGLKILLAEDKLVNQKVVSLLLNTLGHQVEIACNGKEAIEKCRNEKFDLILMDIQMPVMDGLTATRKIKEQIKPLPPIVGLSANAFQGDREKYLSMGMDDYLIKPVESDDFVALINRLNL
jgi:signal transduction histidine kinase/DNA-binding response OmpR family regulator